jgi:hypothetical protein
LGKVEDSALYDYPQKARIVKIRVGINIEEPIRHGMFIGNTRDGINWVDFRYENLPMFCFSCGLIGHNQENCVNPALELSEEGVNPRGPWLRSNIFGKRVHENRDKRFHSNPLQSASGGQFSPIPKAMIDMLAKMKLEEDMEEQNQTKQQATNTTEAGTFKTTTNLNQQNLTPSKRKFLKAPQSTQFIQEISSSTTPKSIMVSLHEMANQGQ